MNLWIGVTSTVVDGKDLKVRRAASSDANLRAKLTKLATDGLKESDGDMPIKITGTWDIYRASAPSDMSGICALVEGDDSVIETVKGTDQTYTVDDTGEVKKVRASK